MLENVKIPKEKNYPFWFGSLVVSLVMYWLGSPPAKDNVIWESSVPIARKIFRYLKSLDSKEEVCDAYFKSFLDMWSVGLISLVFSSGGSSFKKRKRRQFVFASVSELKKRKVDLNEEDIVVIEDLESPIAGGDSTVAKLEDESNLLELVGSMDGWLTLVELDKIKGVLLNHLIQKIMSIDDIINFLLESLNEVLKEFSKKEKGFDMQNLLNYYDDVKKVLSACIEELRVYICAMPTESIGIVSLGS